MYKCIISCPSHQAPHIPFSPSDRYDLSDPSSKDSLSPYTATSDRHFFELAVVDTQPEQQSTLDTNLDQVNDFERESLIAVGIPHLAFIYLALAEYNPLIPEIIDAWIDPEHEQEIVIINVEEVGSSLQEYLQNNELEIIEVLAFLETMTKLWRSLRKIDGCSTLLNLDNLNISVDETLIVDKIYVDKEPPLIRELIEKWAELLNGLSEDYQSVVSNLRNKIEKGEIDDIKQLREELKLVSQEFQLQSILEEQEGVIEFDLIGDEEDLNNITEQLDYDDSFEESEATQINEDIDDQPTVVLPMKLLSIKEAGFTDIGFRRGHNEDSFAIETDVHRQETAKGTNTTAKGLFMVCDGMGGHASGEVASAMAVKHLSNYFRQHWENQLPEAETIKEGILLTNEVIYSLNSNKGNTGAGRMGTTLVMGLLHNNRAAIAHVGDSRAYRYTRKAGLELLTIDHCVAQMEIKQGVEPEIAYGRPDAFQLTQALGPRDNNFVQPEINFFEIKEDTLFLFCSDGLYDNDLLENNYEEFLSPLLSSGSNLDEGVKKIIDLGNQINGHDNLTCVLVRIKVQPNLENQLSLF